MMKFNFKINHRAEIYSSILLYYFRDEKKTWKDSPFSWEANKPQVCEGADNGVLLVWSSRCSAEYFFI